MWCAVSCYSSNINLNQAFSFPGRLLILLGFFMFRVQTVLTFWYKLYATHVAHLLRAILAGKQMILVKNADLSFLVSIQSLLAEAYFTNPFTMVFFNASCIRISKSVSLELVCTAASSQKSCALKRKLSVSHFSASGGMYVLTRGHLKYFKQ